MRKKSLESKRLRREVKRLQQVWYGATKRWPSVSSVKNWLYNEIRCRYCNHDAPIPPRLISADHRIPISRGGSNDPSNIDLICYRHNRLKGALTQEEFMSLLDFLSSWKFTIARKNIEQRLLAAGWMYSK